MARPLPLGFYTQMGAPTAKITRSGLCFDGLFMFLEFSMSFAVEFLVFGEEIRLGGRRDCVDGFFVKNYLIDDHYH